MDWMAWLWTKVTCPIGTSHPEGLDSRCSSKIRCSSTLTIWTNSTPAGTHHPTKSSPRTNPSWVTTMSTSNSHQKAILHNPNHLPTTSSKSKWATTNYTTTKTRVTSTLSITNSAISPTATSSIPTLSTQTIITTTTGETLQRAHAHPTTSITTPKCHINPTLKCVRII